MGASSCRTCGRASPPTSSRQPDLGQSDGTQGKAIRAEAEEEKEQGEETPFSRSGGDESDRRCVLVRVATWRQQNGGPHWRSTGTRGHTRTESVLRRGMTVAQIGLRLGLLDEVHGGTLDNDGRSQSKKVVIDRGLDFLLYYYDDTPVPHTTRLRIWGFRFRRHRVVGPLSHGPRSGRLSTSHVASRSPDRPDHGLCE